MTNYADSELRSDWLHDRPEADHPTRAEAEADAAHDVRPNPDRRPCAGAWGVSHGTPAEMAACVDCNTPFRPSTRHETRSA